MKQRNDPELNLPSFTSRPGIDPVNEGLWSAAAEGRLEIQRCSGCGVHRYPPAHVCHSCGSDAWSWDALPGTGTVFSYVWLPDPGRSADGGPTVYANVVVVELDGTEGPSVRMTSNVVDCTELDSLHVGQRVTLECVLLEEGVGLPCFRCAS